MTVTASYAETPFSLDTATQGAASAEALDVLLDELREMADSTRLQGNFFEELVKLYLTQDSVMGRQFSQVFLWRDWPGRDGSPDLGIDLVAIPKDPQAGPVAVQCKFYQQGYKLQKADLDSFLSESGKEPFTSRIFVETTGAGWSPNAVKAIENQSKPVRLLGLSDLRNSSIDWSTYDLHKPESGAANKERKQLRDHQVRAINDVWNSFDNTDRGTLIMACGTGKTFTSLKLAERFVEKGEGFARVLFMVPSLSLMGQTLEEWSAECAVPFTAWSVCSDATVHRKKTGGADIADIAVTDLKLPPTTDAAALADSLWWARGDEGLQVVFSTYQSVDVVARAQELAGADWVDFDLIICDEAHRTTGVTLTGEDESYFVKIHDGELIRAGKRLYMTATPKLFRSEVKKAASERDAVLASMDDESIFGPVLHRLGFGEAVSQGLLTDYKVVVLAVPEEQMKPLYQVSTANQNSELNLDQTAKLVGTWNALAKRRQGVADFAYGENLAPMRRAVMFAKDIKTSKWVADEFPRLVDRDLVNLLNEDPTDDLRVECAHVDGGMSAAERKNRLDWLRAEISGGGESPVCRVLTNARCLSEGVDVPSLDAVLFLNPRKSQVDVIQAVGRVMRKAPGKEFGYVILPVVIPAGVSAEKALDNNERYRVIWQVLQALRAHDERMDAQINAIAYNDCDPTSIIVDVVDFNKSKAQGSDPFAGDDSEDSDFVKKSTENEVQTALQFTVQDWKDAVYAKIVKKVGNRLYWADWSKDIAEVAERFTMLIENLLDDPEHLEQFESFLDSLRKTLNPQVDAAAAVEMLAQHIITKPLFDAMFAEYEFTEHNPVSRAMQGILEKLASNSVFEKEREPLEKFYSTMIRDIKEIKTMRGKQDILVELYNNFFAKAFPKMVSKLGIVYTPIEVVDYILHSAEYMLQKHFGKSMGDRGVHLIEPFLGTGTFIARLLQSGIIKPEQLQHKYQHEIFANEIVLLSYYIASINIEAVYREICGEQGISVEDGQFPGIVLTDTFQATQDAQQMPHDEVFAENLERIKREQNADIQVIFMNPPYSGRQASANDNNQNNRYPYLFSRIAETYTVNSKSSNRNSLYDSYFLALRWASDRIQDEGIIAFVSNSSFIEGNAAEGVRKCFEREFSEIYIYNLRGGITGKIGDKAKIEGGNVFDIKTGVAVTVLVKTKNQTQPAKIFYREADDYLSREEKLELLRKKKGIRRDLFEQVTPNEHGDWIEHRDDTFTSFQIIGTKERRGKLHDERIFAVHSLGIATTRDPWCWNYSQQQVAENMLRMLENYNGEIDALKAFDDRNQDSSFVSWGGNLDMDYKRGRKHPFDPSSIRKGMYRPFTVASIYYSRSVVERVYQTEKMFPTQNHPNLLIGNPGDYRRDYSVSISQVIPDLNCLSASQWFSLYTWEPVSDFAEPDDLFSTLTSVSDNESAESVTFTGFDFNQPISDQVPLFIDGYRRVDNLTDFTLEKYRKHYADTQIGKEDIFFYIYALLHHPTYRERFEVNLKKELPRIPLCEDFWSYAQIGRELADLHVNYESVEAYPLEVEFTVGAPADEWDLFRVEKMTWRKRGKATDKSELVYNQYITFKGIPLEAEAYHVSGRSPLGWLIDRYQVKTDKASGIVNDPNLYFKEIDNPRYLFNLIPSLISLSLRTQQLIASLPELIITENQKDTDTNE